MFSIGYDPNNGYVERFMFGGGIELHSVIGDLWLWFGIAGLAIAVIMIAVILTGLLRALAVNSVSILFVYLVARFFWDLAYSPVTSTMRLWPIVASLAIAYASYGLRARAPQLQSLFIPSGTLR